MKRISWLALLLAAVMMLGIFAGCASEPTTTTTPEAPATTDTPATNDEPADEPAEDPQRAH